MRGKQRIVDTLVKGEKMRVPRAYARPNDRRARTTKRADSFDRQEKRRNPDLFQLLPQAQLRLRINIAKEGKCEMKLIRRQPTNTAHACSQINQALDAVFRQLKRDEQSLFHDGI